MIILGAMAGRGREQIPGVLRSRTVARLAGVTRRQLGYWHTTELLEAHVMRGAPGRPRLYSWVDYMKVRAAKKLLQQGLTTRRIRNEISYLDAHIPDWYLYPLYGVDRQVVIDTGDVLATARPPRQAAMAVLEQLTEEGPLGELHEFQRYVSMHPDVMAGNPVIRGTRLETRFIRALVDRGIQSRTVADIYHLRPNQVKRALEFDRLAA